MICALIEEAVENGARRSRACRTLGLCARTVERWRGANPQDAREGPHTRPANKITDEERERILAIVNSAAYRNLSPNQIVPRLADEGCYIASESTIYRILREESQMAHRGRARSPIKHVKPVHVATGPNQVWSWDITYLRTPVRGVFSYLYLIMDIWSRKIMGWAVHPVQDDDLASALFEATCQRHLLDPSGIVLHSDNGGPMKGATMVVTLERLGVVQSLSRPGVSDDNPYSEALFRTVKYCPAYPTKPFADLSAAIRWVESFVRWYNHEHRHSGICFVTPQERHTGREKAILAKRHKVYTKARAKNPERWTGTTRNWTAATSVYLNPEQEVGAEAHKTAA